MGQDTPYFEGFGLWLRGRIKARVEKVLPASRCLDDLYAVFGDLFPAQWLEPTERGANSRCRCLPLSVTFWAFVSQILSPKSSCREIARRVEAWWRWAAARQAAATVSAEAYCRARQRLDLTTLREIHDRIAGNVDRCALSSRHPLRGREVKIMDGTGISMPDTAANQAAWPQPATQKPGCGFPQLKFLGLFSLSSGALLDYATARADTHDAGLSRQLWPVLRRGDVLLADRAFCSWAAMAGLQSRGVDVVVRLHQARPDDLRRGHRLGPHDRLVVWEKPRTCPRACSREEWDTLPSHLAVRLIRMTACTPGFRTRKITLATTLTDPLLYPADTLRALYARRWEVELHFAQLKTTQGMDVLRCKSPDMIEKELLLHAITYNLVRALMQKAAQHHDVPLERISFKGTTDALRQYAHPIHAGARHPRRQAHLIEALLAAIAADPVPERPGRREPRVIKRRRKSYEMLNKPRHLMKEIPHRDRYTRAKKNP